jgi:putative CocE/NonD family hydrolase
MIPLHGRVDGHQYAGWTPEKLADSGLGCRLDANVVIPMRDGVRLSADVYRPKKTGRYPAIVQIAAYNKELHAAGVPKGSNEVGSPPVIAGRGYVQVLASRRGMGRSDGTSGMFLDEQELGDYMEAIAWAAEQPWCDGRICLFGTSYYALCQPMLAVRKPPALAAMFANEVCTDLYRHMVAYGGVPNNRFFALWFGANFKDEDFARVIPPWKRAAMSQVINRPWLWSAYVHPRMERMYKGFMTARPSREMRELFVRLVLDSGWRVNQPFADVHERLGEITTPFVAVHNPGMWNLHQFGAFDLFERAATPAGKKFLVIGEAHYRLPVLSWQLEALAFFDHVVKGCDNGYARQPAVRFWREGADDYATSTSFPIHRATRTRLFLDAAGLSRNAPADGTRTWAAIPPSAPLPDGLDEVVDQQLDYELAADTPLTIAGPVTVQLEFSTNEIDSYVVACLARIDRAGERHVLTMGAIRPARRRIDEARTSTTEIAIEDTLEPLIPGRVVVLRFSLTPAASHISAGERLVLQLASRSDKIRGKLADGHVHFDIEAPPYFARNTVHHGASYIEIDLIDS